MYLTRASINVERRKCCLPKVKEYLQQQSWLILGGEPPEGTNHIPVIEVLDSLNFEKGTKGRRLTWLHSNHLFSFTRVESFILFL